MLSLFFLLYVGFLGLSEGAGVLPDGPLDAAIGGSVMIDTTDTTGNQFLTVSWSFGDVVIGSATSANEVIEPDYQGRARIFISNASLELKSLTAADSGEYRVNIVLTSGRTLTGSTTLNVHAPVSNVAINPKTANLIEFNDSLSLSCSSSGSSLSFLWNKDGSDVSDRVQITDGGKMLTIVNVTRDDQGTYTCKVSNPVSSGTSDPATVTVNYGPDTVKLTPSPAETQHAVGSNITMVCSAESRPSSQFTWFLNGSQLLDTGSELKLMNVKVDQSGSYSCQAFNPETLRYQTSEPLSITIQEKISDASVKPTNPPVEGKSLNLTCEASGLVWSRKWMKDGSDLTLNDNMKLYDNNRVLAFTTVSRNDEGEYVCIVSNSINSVRANHSLIVSYGPENVKISGENQIKIGGTINLTCTADSLPLAEFSWLLNETQIFQSFRFIKNNASFSDSGTYTCRATNDITGNSDSAERKLSVSATSEISGEPGGCSVGCIVGIVIACLVVIAAVIGIVFCCLKKKNKEKKSASTLTTGGRAQDNPGYDSEDVNYADVRAFRKNDGRSVSLGMQNTSTDYADVRVNNNRPASAAPPTYDAHIERAKRPAPQPAGRGGR